MCTRRLSFGANRAAAAAGIAGCKVEAPLPAEAQITCGEARSAPRASLCNDSGRCVNAMFDPPSVVPQA